MNVVWFFTLIVMNRPKTPGLFALPLSINKQEIAARFTYICKGRFSIERTIVIYIGKKTSIVFHEYVYGIFTKSQYPNN